MTCIHAGRVLSRMGRPEPLTSLSIRCSGERPMVDLLSEGWADPNGALKALYYAIETDLIVLQQVPSSRSIEIDYTMVATSPTESGLPVTTVYSAYSAVGGDESIIPIKGGAPPTRDFESPRSSGG